MTWTSSTTATRSSTWRGRHAWLAGVPAASSACVIALPLGWLARRYRWLYPPLIVGAGLLYTIPSLALFILLPGFLGTQILDPVNVVVALTIYTVALLVRMVADGLGAVPDDVTQAATAMGYTRVARFFRVELPLAVPVIAAGLRVAAVTNVSIVSVARHDRRRPARAAVHRRLPAATSRPDRARHRRLRPAGPAASTSSSSCSTWLLTPWRARRGAGHDRRHLPG